METINLTPLIEQLEDNIDDLEDVLEPLLGQPLSATTQKMPVMDKAKLHVLITYAIESLIFCTISPLTWLYAHLLPHVLLY